MRKSRVSLFAFAAVLALGGEARADLSSWYSVGFGAARLSADGVDPHWRYQLPFNVGVGTPPSLPVVVGVGVRFNPYFGDGSDYAAYLRLATRGYATGQLGLALDGGGFSRVFDGGSSGWLSTLNVGGPWGLILSGTYERGTNGVQTTSVALGVDLLRLTVYRLGNESMWPNVNPAWRPAGEGPGRLSVALFLRAPSSRATAPPSRRRPANAAPSRRTARPSRSPGWIRAGRGDRFCVGENDHGGWLRCPRCHSPPGTRRRRGGRGWRRA